MTKRAPYRFLHRIALAVSGTIIAIQRERHMKIHLIFCTLILAPLYWIPVPSMHAWLMAILCVLLVITELLNTAIELAVDLATKRYRMRAKLAKDVASGAVLIMAIVVASFGIFVYKPYLHHLIGVFF